eukprot:TRINITY_DN4787_c0_g1_i2.p1 TRINITY_DN4787_c0_g1~~TRINITY_DN4787_c0_g1_i2.p1  ORF type:complete len:470 (+),score=138.04 TRINITY_DN4787_c0_g1_i2:77-1486(+)
MAPGQAVARRRTKAPLVAAAVLAAVYVWAKRTYKQANFPWLVKRLLGWLFGKVTPVPVPRVVSGAGSTAKIGSVLAELKCKKALIVTDEVLVKHGLVKQCTDALQIGYELYDKVVPNPPVKVVDECFDLYKKTGCDSIVAFGGGSPMDVAKVVGAKVANPKNTEDYKGFFKVLKALPPLVAVPTTAGTGSETTVAAVITVPERKEKFAVADLVLVPKVAVLDPKLLLKLPKQITAATGMDALTHAIESYIGAWSSEFTRQQSVLATEKIFKSLLVSYKDGSNEAAREDMLLASFEAGTAFTRASLGYVHAIAHQLGGMYGTPHGEANAMTLPLVLDWYIENAEPGDSCAEACVQRLSELASAAGLCHKEAFTMDASERLSWARKLIEKIYAMNKEMNLSAEVASMKAEDVPVIAQRALNEAHGDGQSMASGGFWLDLGYPVPRYMNFEEMKVLVAKLAPAEERKKVAAA